MRQVEPLYPGLGLNRAAACYLGLEACTLAWVAAAARWVRF